MNEPAEGSETSSSSESPETGETCGVAEPAEPAGAAEPAESAEAADRPELEEGSSARSAAAASGAEPVLADAAPMEKSVHEAEEPAEAPVDQASAPEASEQIPDADQDAGMFPDHADPDSSARNVSPSTALDPLALNPTVLESSTLDSPALDSTLSAGLGEAVPETADGGETESSVQNEPLYNGIVELEQRTHTLPLPIQVWVPDREMALLLARQLVTLPERHLMRPDIPVQCTVAAGQMTLSMQELAGLEVGDVLLPEKYAASEGVVFLRLGQKSGWLCAVEGQTATITSLWQEPTEETTMEPMNQETAAPEGAVSAGIAVAELEVPVLFELERRMLTVQDVASLAPGYTFALGGDPLAPVTLTVNGKAVARGRLVDLNGTLGVQLTEVGAPESREGEGRA